MWKEISTEKDLLHFMREMYYFHDSCIKELQYTSGAYVAEDLSMYPINDRRILRVIVQRQFPDNPMMELEFSGLKFLKLFPVDDQYTCEILETAMFFKEGLIYWCDHEDSPETDSDGFLVCASKLRWRAIDRHMGPAEYYSASL